MLTTQSNTFPTSAPSIHPSLPSRTTCTATSRLSQRLCRGRLRGWPKGQKVPAAALRRHNAPRAPSGGGGKAARRAGPQRSQRTWVLSQGGCSAAPTRTPLKQKLYYYVLVFGCFVLFGFFCNGDNLKVQFFISPSKLKFSCCFYIHKSHNPCVNMRQLY